MEFYLKITEGPESGLQYTCKGMQAMIGRDLECEVTLTDSKASRHHVSLKAVGGKVVLEDLKSSNGTRLNGEKVAKAELEDGDRITIGRTKIIFQSKTSVDTEIPDGSHDKTISVDTNSLLRKWPGDDSIESLQQAKANLETVYRIGRMANTVLDTKELAESILELIFKELQQVDRASIYLLESGKNSDETLRSLSHKVRLPNMAQEAPPLSRTLSERVLKSGQAILTEDAQQDDRFDPGESIRTQQIRAAICVPLVSKEKVNGLLYADVVQPDNNLAREDLHLLAAIGLQMGAQMESARLYETLAQEKANLHEAQAQLLQSEKLAAVGRLAAGIAHDIKTPLGVLLGYTGMIRAKLDQPEVGKQDVGKMRQYTEELEKAIEHSDSLLQNLLMFAQPTEPEISPVNLNELVDETLAMMKYEFYQKGVAVKQAFTEPPPIAMADATQLKQVLINLATNALHAFDKEAKVLTIRTEAYDVSPPIVQFIVSDNGKGITSEDIQHIFEPFYTTKRGEEGIHGNGLGLSVCYSLIQAHKGRIDVVSAPKEGTIFTISLPAAKARP